VERAPYLSEDWFRLNLQAASGWPERPGVDCVADFEVTGAPGGKTRYHLVVHNGRMVEIAPGKADNADVGIVYKYADACAEVAGGQHPDLAYMSGRMRLEGEYARWVFGLRPLLDSTEHAAYRSEVAEHTCF